MFKTIGLHLCSFLLMFFTMIELKELCYVALGMEEHGRFASFLGIGTTICKHRESLVVALLLGFHIIPIILFVKRVYSAKKSGLEIPMKSISSDQLYLSVNETMICIILLLTVGIGYLLSLPFAR